MFGSRAVEREPAPGSRRLDMCRMAEFVVREAILPDLKETAKDGVIREMVKNLQSAGYFPGCETDEIVKAILRREQLGSTGIGRHIAIPHAKHASRCRWSRAAP